MNVWTDDTTIKSSKTWKGRKKYVNVVLYVPRYLTDEKLQRLSPVLAFSHGVLPRTNQGKRTGIQK